MTVHEAYAPQQDDDRQRLMTGPAHVSPGEALEDITSRELEVLQKLATGLENSQICKELGISDSTLRTHLRALFQKMQVPNRTACVVKGIRLGWV